MAKALGGDIAQATTQPPHEEDLPPGGEMELRDLIETHKDLITDRLDPDFGLLDKLLSSRSLTIPEVDRVEAVPDSYGKGVKVLEYVFQRGIYKKFLDALRETQQTHLVNFILSNGERRPRFGDDWPLTEREISILDTNHCSLVDSLETCELLPRLYSDKVISNRQKYFVSSKTTSHEKNDALLQILRRTSLGNYKKIFSCLQTTKQSHIADILKKGGVDVGVSSERETIEKMALKISAYMNEMLLMKTNNVKKKEDFCKEIDETEKDIHERNQELKDMIDRHTRLLLDELAVIKSKHLKEIDNQMEEIERYRTVIESFEAYCRELTLKGSASDICSSVDELIVRADELERDQKAFIGRLQQSINVSFQATDLTHAYPNTYINFVGAVEETNAEYENFALIVGINDGKTVNKDVVKINLNQPNEITTEEQLPTSILGEAFAAVYKNTTYVTGMGHNADEIWKYKNSVGWKQCASLVEGRRRHSAAFIDEVLYICGGFVDSTKLVLDSVEAFNSATNKCAAVGKLVHGVMSSGNCVPFKTSLYIFGGSDKDSIAFNHVQVYNTKDNTCSVLSRPMPRPYKWTRVVLWETSAILLGYDTCFIFNIETETWQERKQFKSDVIHFGLVLENGRLFVIGGGLDEKDKDGKNVWKCRDDVRYVPLQNIFDDNPIEWKIHGKLPKPCVVHAYANIRQLRPQST